MRALSIRQPFAELILRGIKTVEYRSRATNIIEQRFYIQASRKPLSLARIWGEEAPSTGENRLKQVAPSDRLSA